MNMDVRPASLVHHDGTTIFYPGTFQDDLGGVFLTIQKPMVKAFLMVNIWLICG